MVGAGGDQPSGYKGTGGGGGWGGGEGGIRYRAVGNDGKTLKEGDMT